MKKILSLTALLITSSAFAEIESEQAKAILESSIGSITIEEVVTNDSIPFIPTLPSPTIPSVGNGPGGTMVPPSVPSNTGVPGAAPGAPKPSGIERTRQVISTAKEFVALGEAVYELVKKGKPSNTTKYEAISVVPKVPGTNEYVDPFDLEGFGIPEERNFTAVIRNGAGTEVVRFDYTLIYSYGGTYNGAGQYLSNVMIVPKYVKTTHGWDFTATMSLSGIMNHGSRANPVAGALVAIKYQMNNWRASFERNDTIHVTGKGQVRSYGLK